jgi:hypothetical protein
LLLVIVLVEEGSSRYGPTQQPLTLPLVSWFFLLNLSSRNFINQKKGSEINAGEKDT